MGNDGIREIINTLCDASGFDEMFGVMVLDTFLKQSLEIVSETKTELKCLNLDSHEKIANNMHKLKGSSGNVRAYALMEMAKTAELLGKDKRTEELNEQIELMDILLQKYQSELANIQL